MSMTPCCLLVGVGSMLGDDQVGWVVAQRIVEQLAASTVDADSATGTNDLNCRFASGRIGVKLASVPLDVLDWLSGVRQLHIVDACRSCFPAGRIHRFEWKELETMAASAPSDLSLQIGGRTTHDYGIVEALKLADRTGRLPEEVVVWAIDGKQFHIGNSMTAEVERAVPVMVGRILADVAAGADSSTVAAD